MSAYYDQVMSRNLFFQLLMNVAYANLLNHFEEKIAFLVALLHLILYHNNMNALD